MNMADAVCQAEAMLDVLYMRFGKASVHLRFLRVDELRQSRSSVMNKTPDELHDILLNKFILRCMTDTPFVWGEKVSHCYFEVPMKGNEK